MYRIILLLFLAIAGTAQAGLIMQTQNFNLSTPVVGGIGNAVGVNFFDTFDTAQGQLDSVDLQIFGTITAQIRFRGFIIPFSPVRTPVAFNMSLEQSFGGIDFGLAPTSFFSGAGSSGTVLPIVIVYQHTMTFNRTPDGFAPVTTSGWPGIPPAFATNLMADFESAIAFPFVIIPTLSISPISGFFESTTGTLNSFGLITMTYNFTEPPAPVPEPGTLLLFLTGIGLVVRFRATPRSH